ncbi:MAG: aminopeptidase P family protein [Lachnospiraceae bacterium]|nr:aminopeptidase P family protein [Lachnospiraceae bacterium]
MPERRQVKAMRRAMNKRGITWYLVPTSDDHGSEYVDGFFKTRAWLTGFTGSAGTALVGPAGTWLWTDGRYFVQAEEELRGRAVTLMKMREEGVPTIEDFLAQYLYDNDVLGFDGRLLSCREAEGYVAAAKRAGAAVVMDADLASEAWEDRPAMSKNPAWFMTAEEAGESREKRLARLRIAMREEGATVHLIPSLDDIAWLFLMRGSDVRCNPVVLSYAAVEEKKAYLFVQDGVVSAEDAAALAADGVTLRPYAEFYDYIAALPRSARVWYDPARANAGMVTRLKKGMGFVTKASPIQLWKACKNHVEMDRIRLAHEKDGAAMVKFLCWLQDNKGKIPMTELSLAEKLDSLRSEQEGFLDLSFGTISAYGPNAAMPHYCATPEKFSEVKRKGFYLVDSGAQYREGTTDITRTVAMGRLTKEEKLHYTLVLKGHIGLATARFPQGVRGLTLDAFARRPLWDMGLDYNHGTGHGVGYVLNVHEGPNNIRWMLAPGGESAQILEGMLTSNEPGYYEPGSHGIRTENLVLCVKDEKTAYGQFLRFETVTLCPIDLTPVLPELLTQEEKDWLNAYHARVREVLSPRLTEHERAWLKKATKAI